MIDYFRIVFGRLLWNILPNLSVQFCVVILVLSAFFSSFAKEKITLDRRVMKDKQSIECLEVSPAGDKIVVLDQAGVVGVLDAFDEKSKFRKKWVDESNKVNFSSDGKQVYVARVDGKITILDSVTLDELKTVTCCEKPCDEIKCVGKLVVVVDRDGLNKIFVVEKKTAFRHILTLEHVVETNARHWCADAHYLNERRFFVHDRPYFSADEDGFNKFCD